MAEARALRLDARLLCVVSIVTWLVAVTRSIPSNADRHCKIRVVVPILCTAVVGRLFELYRRVNCRVASNGY